MNCSLPLFYPWTTQARILEWISLSRDLPDLGTGPTSPALQADSLPLSHQGSPYWILYWKWKTERPYEYRMALCVSVVYPHDHAADWELQLAVAAQHHESIVPHTTNPGEKNQQNSNFEVQFLLNVYSFLIIVVKKSNEIIVGQGPPITWYRFGSWLLLLLLLLLSHFSRVRLCATP